MIHQQFILTNYSSPPLMTFSACERNPEPVMDSNNASNININSSSSMAPWTWSLVILMSSVKMYPDLDELIFWQFAVSTRIHPSEKRLVNIWVKPYSCFYVLKTGPGLFLRISLDLHWGSVQHWVNRLEVEIMRHWHATFRLGPNSKSGFLLWQTFWDHQNMSRKSSCHNDVRSSDGNI